MIQVPNTTPDVVTFYQKGRDEVAGRIAGDQIAKAARMEVEALSAVDNANFRLVKATEQMKAAEIAYFTAVEKGASNREELRSIYNNTLAGYRDADKAAEKAVDELSLVKSALEGLRDIAKREVSDTERQDLAEKGKAMPDGSYPIKTVGDLKNAISSYGRAKNPDAVKAHIIAQAKALNATDQLPESWSDSTTKSLRKDAAMADTYNEAVPAALRNLCPSCMGHGEESCPTCKGAAAVSDEMVLGSIYDYPDNPEHPMMKNAFSTEALLTRDFQKSAAYQNYIFTKGGEGSGAQPGHPFNGNQYTGGVSTSARGIKEGWKSKMARYAKAAEGHIANGVKAMADGRALKAAGQHAAAAAKFLESKGHFEKGAGAHYGISTVLKEHADHPDVKSGKNMPAGVQSQGFHYGEADRIRTDLKAGAAYQADLASRKAAGQ